MEVPDRGQGFRSEETLSCRFRIIPRYQFPRLPNTNEYLESTHDTDTMSAPLDLLAFAFLLLVERTLGENLITGNLNYQFLEQSNIRVM